MGKGKKADYEEIFNDLWMNYTSKSMLEDKTIKTKEDLRRWFEEIDNGKNHLTNNKNPILDKLIQTRGAERVISRGGRAGTYYQKTRFSQKKQNVIQIKKQQGFLVFRQDDDVIIVKETTYRYRRVDNGKLVKTKDAPKYATKKEFGGVFLRNAETGRRVSNKTRLVEEL